MHDEIRTIISILLYAHRREKKMKKVANHYYKELDF